MYHFPSIRLHNLILILPNPHTYDACLQGRYAKQDYCFPTFRCNLSPLSSSAKDPGKWYSSLLLILCSLVFKVHITEVSLSCPQSAPPRPLALGTTFRRLTALNCFLYFLLLFTCLKCIFFCDCIYSFPICLSPFCLKLSLLAHPHAICRFLSFLPHSHSELSCPICSPHLLL